MLNPDFDGCLNRMEAFWEHQVLERPVVQFRLDKTYNEQQALPTSKHDTPAERWLDAEFQAETALAQLNNQLFMGDTIPVAWPNLGPDVFAAFYGCPLEFGDYGTAWSKPILGNWNRAEQIRLDWNNAMFEEFFLPGIQRECQFLERAMYHLDGPGSLRHLESILTIPELQAVQFVPTPGFEAFSTWSWVYQRIQSAGKSLQVTCNLGEIKQVIEALKPAGLYLVVNEVNSPEAGEWLLEQVSAWEA